ILFPEMSLTGYTREKASRYAMMRDDPRLEKLRNMAMEYQMIIIAGAPVRLGREMYIGSFIFLHDGSESIYLKKFLHAGEEKYYMSSLESDPVIEFQNESLSIIPSHANFVFFHSGRNISALNKEMRDQGI
ncbi:MAG: hypothetical protein KFF73_10540, partial [Cyclobacteriaceae bacterium]|nr:hypothetical protein [Cyclobacteriaceae bacterium]